MSNNETPTILIAADSEFCSRIGKILREGGYKTHESNDLFSALEFVQNECPPLLITYVCEREDFGVGVCTQIKQNSACSSTLVLQISPEWLINPDGTSQEVGCEPDAVLAEPFHAHNFLSNIRSLLRFQKSQSELRVRDERNRAFIQNSSEGIWRAEVEEPIDISLPVDEQIRLAYRYSYIAEANDAMAQMYGLESSESLNGARLGDLLVESDPKNYEYLRAFIESGYRLTDAESHEVDVNGNDVYFLNNLIGTIENGKLVRAWGTQRNITEQKRAESALRESEERQRLFTENLNNVFWIFNWRKGRAEYVSPAFERITGLDPQRIFENHDNWLEMIHPEDKQKSIKTFKQIAVTGRYENEFRIVRKDGSVRWLLDRGLPLFNGDGKISRVIGVAEDITERKQAEERFRVAVESAPNSIIMVNKNGKIGLVNSQTEKLFGYKRAELLGESIEMLVPERFRRQHAAMRSGFMQNPQTRNMGVGRDLYCLRKDGSEVPVEIGLNPLSTSEGEFVLISIIDITERKQAEKERDALLERELDARRDAELANRAKDEFLAVLSHELRTPLNAMYGWARMLASGTLDEAMQTRAIEVIERNIQVQSKLIEDILDVSRIVSGKVKLEPHRTDLVALLKTAAEMSRPSAALKQISIETKSESESVAVMGDTVRLQQVFTNLISNAVKFTPSGGEIVISIEERDGWARASVTDSGIGISPDFLPHVFDRFRQGDSSSKRRHGGLGLGLAIVKHLVELHHGKVSALSEGENKGATFTVELPLVNQQSTVNNQQLPLDEIKLSADNGSLFSGLRILTVEDDSDTAEVLRMILSRHGAQVIQFGTAREALAELKKTKFDLIISDIGLPEIDGTEFIRQLRNSENKNLRRLPAIALTAYVGAQNRQRILSAGFDECLAKPINFDNLQSAIADVMKGSFAAISDFKSQISNLK